MIANYTPIDINKYNEKESNQLNFFLLITATIIAIFLAIFLFILIQKKTQKAVIVPTPPIIENQPPLLTPTITETVVDTPTPSIAPTIATNESPSATTSPTIVVPNETTQSAKIATESAR
jgi:hypothetical protein